jgi:hypothetical protein
MYVVKELTRDGQHIIREHGLIQPAADSLVERLARREPGHIFYSFKQGMVTAVDYVMPDGSEPPHDNMRCTIDNVLSVVENMWLGYRVYLSADDLFTEAGLAPAVLNVPRGR